MDCDDNNCANDLACAGCCDLDADGFLPSQGDCDESDASVHPGAPELCDGQDNDCDGMVDEGVVQEICDNGLDDNGDGRIDCTDPCCVGRPGCFDGDGDGFSPNSGDCDDDDPAVHPGALEVCDGVDNDCNGLIDETCGDDDDDDVADDDDSAADDDDATSDDDDTTGDDDSAADDDDDTSDDDTGDDDDTSDDDTSDDDTTADDDDTDDDDDTSDDDTDDDDTTTGGEASPDCSCSHTRSSGGAHGALLGFLGLLAMSRRGRGRGSPQDRWRHR